MTNGPSFETAHGFSAVQKIIMAKLAAFFQNFLKKVHALRVKNLDLTMLIQEIIYLEKKMGCMP